MDILNQKLFEYAKLHPITKGILYLVKSKLERQLLFFKSSEETTKDEFLYWYPSLNSGLQLVDKPDEIHQAVYVFHDMVHTCLYDPLPDCNKKTYLLGKMVGEVMAQLIADGIFASLLKEQHDKGYDYEKRYYIQMFSALKGHHLKELSVAIAHFAIFNNRTKLIRLCKNSHAKKWAHVYCNLYYKMFSADLWWNNEIYKQFENKKFEYEASLCYNNNKKIDLNTIEEVVDYNFYLLDAIYEKDEGNGMKLAEQLSSKKGHFVYDFVTVNYKSVIDEELLESIRNHLREEVILEKHKQK